jgi:hypothetical protein
LYEKITPLLFAISSSALESGTLIKATEIRLSDCICAVDDEKPPTAKPVSMSL